MLMYRSSVIPTSLCPAASNRPSCQIGRQFGHQSGRPPGRWSCRLFCRQTSCQTCGETGRQFSRQSCRLFYGLLVAAIGTLSGVLQAAELAAVEFIGYDIAEVPAWVKPVTAFDPELEATGEDSHGFHSRLQDFQFNALTPGESETFFATEFVVSNRYGVENYSTIEIEFDPSYEQLTLHEVLIQRDDRVLNKLPGSRRTVLQREQELDALIYDGTQTLAVVLADVRVGDTIRYAYTLRGENPIFADNREFRIHTELWMPIDRQYTRVLSPSSQPLLRRIRGRDVPVTVRDQDGVQEVVIDQRGVPEFNREDDVPSWRNARGTVVFSDMQNWKDVNDWALPMYQLPAEATPEVATIASVIRSAHDSDASRIGAALRWVQDEVRYFGVELGTNSHWPSRPEETLARRFGDCKDKTLLLIALLRELDVVAEPALVNTRRGLEAESYPYRLHAFNHVIAHVSYAGQSHFIDPTVGYQMGALGDVHEPNYGRALVLSADTTGLVDMGQERSVVALSVSKQLSLSDNPESPVLLNVETERRGYLAEMVRYSLETDGIRQLASNYQSYYRDYFAAATATQRPTINDAPNNRIEISEQYRITDFWLADENVERYRWLYADEIIGYLDNPDETAGRQQSYELRHPIDITEHWQVSLPDALRLDDLDAEIINDWLHFRKTHTLSEDGKELKVSMHFKTLSNEVPANELENYKQSVLAIEDAASFYVEDAPAMSAAMRAAVIPVQASTKSQIIPGRYWMIGIISIGLFLLAIFYMAYLPARCQSQGESADRAIDLSVDDGVAG